MLKDRVCIGYERNLYDLPIPQTTKLQRFRIRAMTLVSSTKGCLNVIKELLFKFALKRKWLNKDRCASDAASVPDTEATEVWIDSMLLVRVK